MTAPYQCLITWSATILLNRAQSVILIFKWVRYCVFRALIRAHGVHYWDQLDSIVPAWRTYKPETEVSIEMKKRSKCEFHFRKLCMVVCKTVGSITVSLEAGLEDGVVLEESGWTIADVSSWSSIMQFFKRLLVCVMMRASFSQARLLAHIVSEHVHWLRPDM